LQPAAEQTEAFNECSEEESLFFGSDAFPVIFLPKGHGMTGNGVNRADMG
jgi:hypothetical protein